MDRLSEAAPGRVPPPGLRGPGLHRLLPAGHAHRRGGGPAHRLAAGQAPAGRPHRGPARDPLGVQLDPEPARHPGMVRPGRRPRGRDAAGRGRRAASGSRRCTAEWAFFRSLLDNAQISLGKSDLAVARLYDGLAGPPDLRARVFAAVAEEWRRTEEAILAVTGQPAILSGSPVLRESIRLRNPYVDPMSFAQVSLLARLRSLPEDVARARRRAPAGGPDHQRRGRRPAEHRVTGVTWRRPARWPNPRRPAGARAG